MKIDRELLELATVAANEGIVFMASAGAHKMGMNGTHSPTMVMHYV